MTCVGPPRLGVAGAAWPRLADASPRGASVPTPCSAHSLRTLAASRLDSRRLNSATASATSRAGPDQHGTTMAVMKNEQKWLRHEEGDDDEEDDDGDEDD